MYVRLKALPFAGQPPRPAIGRKHRQTCELRGAGVVKVNHMPGEANPADLFTKILGRQVFEKHRKVVLNLPAGSGLDTARAFGRGAGKRWPAA